MSAPKPVCQAATAWIREVKGTRVLAPFTGQDFPAFKTFVHALELYTFSDPEGRKNALLCMRHAVLAMQPETRWIAQETIAHQLDWDDRWKLWAKIVTEDFPRLAPTGGAA
jgi:hypothetical protein